MSARDKFHDSVKQGLENEGWEITHDPLQIEFGEDDKIGIDLVNLLVYDPINEVRLQWIN